MLLAWFGWWWSDQGLDRAQVILGGLSLFASTVLAVIAWLLSRRQTAMQTEQHDSFKAQQSKRTDLRLIVQGTTNNIGSRNPHSPIEERSTIRFHVQNGGNKSADGFYWEILVPENLSFRLDFANSDGETITAKWSHISATEHYRKMMGITITSSGG